MPERLKQILDRVLQWWNKFTARQKSIIIGVGATVVFAFAIIIYTFSRAQYDELLITCETESEAAQVIGILDEQGIPHEESKDALLIYVEKDQYTTAKLALATEGYQPAGMTINDVVNGSMSTTTADKEKLYKAYMEQELEKTFQSISTIKEVDVHLNIADQVNTLLAQQVESSAYIQLTLDGTFTSANAAAMAKAAATFLGNKTTANITITDSDSNLLFAGGDDYSSAGIASSYQELQNQAEAMVANQVKKVLLGTKQFTNVEVTSHLIVDFADYEETTKEYSAPDGREEGMKSYEENFEYEGENDGGGEPGAASNDGTVTYVNPDSNNSSTTQTENSVGYLPNERIEYKVTPAGAINYGSSSISIAAIVYREVYEADVRTQGLLDGISWEEYKIANSTDVRREVDEEFYNMVSTATGIDRENITIIAYESPFFYDQEGMSIDWTDVMSIVMLVIILALLAFVVLRSMRTRAQGAETEELAVENLLQSTPNQELDDIDTEAKSETRRMIEKFAEDNPEAAAALLRNWLNADWV